MKNYPLSSRCARQLLKMTRQLVNREDLGRMIAQTSGVILMINESNYNVRSKSGYNTYSVTATQSGWICSCPDYACHNAKCTQVLCCRILSRDMLARSRLLCKHSCFIITNKQNDRIGYVYLSRKGYSITSQGPSVFHDGCLNSIA
jgi:hypothetical protein